MGQIQTQKFKLNLAQQFYESIAEAANTIYYVTAHNSIPYADDLDPPEFVNSINETHYQLYDSMLFGKHVTADDIAFMAKLIEWESGAIYDSYDDQVADLQTKNFFVASIESGNYHIFKCIYNGGGVPSTDRPLFSETGADDELYILDDGYHWKYMATTTVVQWNKFKTSDYMPIFPNANVSANAVSGAIDHILLLDGGSQNNNYANGTFSAVNVASNNLIHSIVSDTVTLSSNADFYQNASLYISSGPGEGQLRNINEYIVTGSERRVQIDRAFDITPGINSVFEISPRVVIRGDGANAQARSVIDPNGNTVSDIIIINRGSEYTYADVEIVANTGIVGETTTTAATSRAIIPPPGGHGYDILSELNATRVGISVNYNGNESGTIAGSNDYRTVALLKDPLFDRVVLTANTELDLPTQFTPGETVIQQGTLATGVVSNREASDLTLTNIRGFLLTSNGDIGANTAGQLVVGQTSGAELYVDSIDRTFETVDQTTTFNVTITYTGPTGDGFEEDEPVVQPGLSNIASNILKLTLDVDPTTFTSGETITQANTGATGIVSNRDDTLALVSVSGNFAIGNTSVNYITGGTSSTVAAVTAIDNTVMANAVGNIYTLNGGASNTNIITLTNVKGNFALSDDETNTINTFRGQKTRAEAKLIDKSVSKNQFVDNSGSFLFAQNFQPIQRTDIQLETIKLIIEF